MALQLFNCCTQFFIAFICLTRFTFLTFTIISCRTQSSLVNNFSGKLLFPVWQNKQNFPNNRVRVIKNSTRALSNNPHSWNLFHCLSFWRHIQANRHLCRAMSGWPVESCYVCHVNRRLFVKWTEIFALKVKLRQKWQTMSTKMKKTPPSSKGSFLS